MTGFFPTRTRWFAAILLLVATLFLGTTATPAAALESFPTTTLRIETKAGRAFDFTVEIATSLPQREQGLMFRQTLKPDAGMLFIGPEDETETMWMKNTVIPLDMVFIARDGTITGYHERAVPQSLDVISSGVPVHGVLELNAGTVARLGLHPGDHVTSPALN
jgi:uncharacterized membrane protein (UPF0127 family)